MSLVSDGFQQNSCVIRRLCSGKKHLIVASPLSFDSQSAGGHPCQRIKPMNGARNLGDDLSKIIQSPDMHQFVQQNGTPLLIRPSRALRRQQDHRTKHAPGHGRDGLIAFNQPHLSFDAELISKTFQQTAP